MKRAIALAGGGSKGSYHMGVWRALREMKVNYHIVTGNSIGSLNGALMVQGDYEMAWELWNNLSSDKIMDSSFGTSDDYDYYSEHREQIMPFLKKYISNKGADITPYLNLLDQYIDEKKFFKSKIDYGIMTVKSPSLAPKEVLKSDIKPGYLKKWIQASSAIFPAFPMCKIDDETYIDGLYYDNLPIGTAFRLGADEVIAVALRPNISKKKYSGNPLVKFIEPSESLGAILTFENQGIKKNIVRGYNDAMRTLGNYEGFDYTFKNTDKKICTEIARKMFLTIMNKELEKEISKASLISRYVSPTPLTDKIFKFNDKCSNDLFSTFVMCVETFMKKLDYDYYKVYDMKEVLKEFESKVPREILRIVRVLKTEKYNIEKLQTFPTDDIVSALLVFALISR